MKLHHPNAHILVPDQQALPAALKRITHLGIGAHPDDLEFMAFHGILNCFESKEAWFGGVTCSNGAGSARTGRFAAYSNEQMALVRQQEQCEAAHIGRYGVMLQLGYSSHDVKNPADVALKEDLKHILLATQPRVVYTHNPADKHDTHIGVLVATIQAMRELAPEQRPQQVIGCEMWRDLDWLPDEDKISMDVSENPILAAALTGVFASQIDGGKRYDLAIQGRRTAHATFSNSHQTDLATQLIIGMDLTPLVKNVALDISDFVDGFLNKFQAQVRQQLRRFRR